MLTRTLRNPDLWLGLVLVLIAAWGALLIAAHAFTMPVLPADAYFYLSKAENLAAGRGLTTYWNDGVDRKFFPLNSIVLAPFSLLRSALPNYWAIPETLYYLLTGLVLAILVRRMEPMRSVAVVATALWLANPNVILWHAVPYAEGLATLLLWTAVLLCSRGWRICGAPRFFLAAALAGLGLIARAEAILILVPLGVSVLLILRREGFSGVPWRRLALGLAIFILPLAIWWLSIPSTGGVARLAYVEEFGARFTWDQLATNFRVLFSSVLFEINLRPASPWQTVAMIVGSRLYLVTIGLALAGALGSRGRWVLASVVGYQMIHALWHYAYGRFNLIMLPLAMYLFALGIRWIFASWARLALAMLVVINGDLLGLVGGAAAQIRPLLMINEGILVGLLVGLFERSRDVPVAATLRTGLSGIFDRARVVVRRPLPLAYGFAVALASVMFNLGNGAILRHKEFLIRDDGRTSIRGRHVEAIVARIGGGESCLAPVDFPLAYQVGSLTGDRIWFSGGLGDFFLPAFDPRETARFLDEKNIRVILTPRAADSWTREFHIPANQSGRLSLQKSLPGAQLLQWDS